ncbi:MAG: carbohydrate binding family 9 domain-containing protein [Acidobacteria bacterium]|nr:carbohydrate binding family 9 domain-containing protein [Acidobacteriota bacterium]
MKRCLVGLSSLLFAVSGWCQPGAARLAHAARTQHAPKIDGTLDDPAWAAAPAIGDFRQKEPLEIEPATERTEVRVLYDGTHIYFGIHCFDRDPKAIVATQLRRDLSQDLDDNFAIMIDPALSRRNGYIFQINALGTERDGEVIEEREPSSGDSIVDADWDGRWISAARITDDGWTATVEIPFSTLNFRGGADVNWGLNFRRFIRRKNEEDVWAGYRHSLPFWRVSQAGELTGLSGVEHSRLLVIKPYALLGGQAFQGQPWSALHTAGGDVKYGLASNLIAVGTVNTDFSDADVDQQQFNLTPYPIFIPEKRRFFLENSDVFAFPLWLSDYLFFSRQIGIDPNSGQEVPIDGGGKIAGQLGGFDLGVMDVKTRAAGINPEANYAVVRVKKPLIPGSYIGFIATDKESGSAADPYNRSGGVDAKFLFFKNLNLRAYYAKTWSPGLNSQNAAFAGRLRFINNWVNIWAGHGITERNFNAEMGFITRTDDEPTIVGLTFMVRPRRWDIREIDFGPWISNDPNTRGERVYREITPSATVLLNNAAVFSFTLLDTTFQRLTGPLHLYKGISVPTGDYRFATSGLTVRSPAHRLTWTGGFNLGTYYGGNLKSASASAEYRPNAHMDFTINDVLNAFALPQGNFSINLGGFQASYALNRFLNGTTFIQVDTSQTQAVSVNFRVRYTFRPDSDLYVIYNAGTRFQALAAGNPENVRQQKVAIKITYSWSR